jgi:hypothetical protein
MPIFGKFSQTNLISCHPDLQEIAKRAIVKIDFQVRDGHRGQGQQEKLFNEGLTMQHFPNSYHNNWPGLAFDYVPFPFDDTDEAWRETDRFKAVFDALSVEAYNMDIVLFWGGEWTRLNDIDHVQLVSKNGIMYPKMYKMVDM